MSGGVLFWGELGERNTVEENMEGMRQEIYKLIKSGRRR